MKPPFTLVPDSISNDTVECLQQLLREAKRGELIGIAYCGILRRRNYICNSAGEAFRSPTFARGCVAALSDKLGQRVQGGNP